MIVLIIVKLVEVVLKNWLIAHLFQKKGSLFLIKIYQLKILIILVKILKKVMIVLVIQ